MTKRPRFSPSSSDIRCSISRSTTSGARLLPTRRITSLIKSSSCARHSVAGVAVVAGGLGLGIYLTSNKPASQPLIFVKKPKPEQNARANTQ